MHDPPSERLARNEEALQRQLERNRQLHAAPPHEQLAAAIRVDQGFTPREKLRAALWLLGRGEDRLVGDLLAEAIVELGDG